MLFTKAVAGDYEGNVAIETKVMWSGITPDKFKGITFMNAKILYTPEQISRVVQLSEEKARSFLGTAVKGAVGGLLLGGVGFLAGALVGGKNTVLRLGLELSDGKKVIIEQHADNAALKCFLMYAKASGVLEQDLGF